MKKLETLHLLLLDDSANRAEQISNVLRNSGQVVRSVLVQNMQALEEALNQHHSWELMVARPEANGVSAFEALHIIHQHEKDIPLIILSPKFDVETVTDALEHGARAVVYEDNMKQLLIQVNREVDNLLIRRARKEAEFAYHESERRSALLLASSREAIAYIHEGMHIYANPAYVSLFGYTDAEELAGMPLMNLVASFQHTALKEYLTENKDKSHAPPFEFMGKYANQGEFSARLFMSPAEYHGEMCTQIIIRTNQELRGQDETTRLLAQQDLLTGLFNRQYLVDLIDKSVSQAASGGESSIFFYVLINDFSVIKESVGLGGSDLVLGDAAKMLRQVASQATLARYSDEVFGVLLNPGTYDEAMPFAEKIYNALNDHLSEVGKRSINITCSIGIAFIGDTAPSAQDILARAYNVCMKARTASDVRILIYQPDMEEENTFTDQSLVSGIQQALDNGQFSLLYQPIVNLHGEAKAYYEVSIRMVDNEGKEMQPGEFFPTAGQAGLMTQVDRWVIMHATKLLSEHRLKGSNAYLFIRVSEHSLFDDTLLSWISVALQTARLPSDAIIFEINETDATAHLKQAKNFFKGLNELHCKTALSHFGSGVNSFVTLKHLNPDFVKLDTSLMAELFKQGPEGMKALAEIVTSIHGQGKLTIVPMVENPTILPQLWQIGVNYIQGHFLRPPGPALDYDFPNNSDEKAG